jgi:hypothetical protein
MTESAHTGLSLSRAYFFDTALPELKREFGDLTARLAAGLCGNGSECFGYDDEISRDHDWGTDFFLWVPEADREWIPALTTFKSRLFEERPPLHRRTRSEYGARVGVLTVGDFYRSLIGTAHGPSDLPGWYRVPEENLALSVNGEVFIDGAGEFTKTREYLLGYFPEDLRRKRISYHCMSVAQSGQYNLRRMYLRGDFFTARTALSRFSESVIALVLLLNRVFCPYYKWAFRKMREQPILGGVAADMLTELAVRGGIDEPSFLSFAEYRIEALCSLIADELKKQGLAGSSGTFLTAHGEEIRALIEDETLRNLPAQYKI